MKRFFIYCLMLICICVVGCTDKGSAQQEPNPPSEVQDPDSPNEDQENPDTPSEDQQDPDSSDEDQQEPETPSESQSFSVPMSHILICCRSSNEGVIKFKVGDQWITDHSYKNIDHARAILSTIQEAGINDVIIDLTNPSQWESIPGSWPGCQPNEGALWEIDTKDQIATIEQVCTELGMHFVMFIGNPAAHTLAYWNRVAKRIWENWANKEVYRKYGFGDDRPMLVVYYMGEDFWKMYDAAPSDEKNYLAKFRIGTCQVNSPMNFGPTDGWGYRHKSSSSDNKVRFACPNEGVPPTDWKTQHTAAVEREGRMGRRSNEYSIFGSYDDTCDAIFWGIGRYTRKPDRVQTLSEQRSSGCLLQRCQRLPHQPDSGPIEFFIDHINTQKEKRPFSP